MKRYFILFLILVLNLELFCDQFFSGEAFFNNYSAMTLPMGYVQLSTHGRIFREADVWGEGVQLVDASGIFGINFGYSNNLEFGVNTIFYQDLNRNVQEAADTDLVDNNIPDATYLRLKYRGDGMEIGDYLGILAMASSFKISSKKTNSNGIALEPYTSEDMQFNITGVFSVFFDPLYLNEEQSLHFNLGYILHNDSENHNAFKGFSEGASELTYGVAYSYPTSYVNLNIEAYGNLFLTTLDSALEASHYSTESYLYITPSIKYKAYAGLNFDVGVDILAVAGAENYSKAEAGKSFTDNENLPYYPSWRMLLRANYTPSTPYVDIPSFSSSTGVKARVANSRQVRNRKELFEWLIEEPDRVEYIDMKLDKLRTERKQIEEDIEKLREEMEDE